MHMAKNFTPAQLCYLLKCLAFSGHSFSMYCFLPTLLVGNGESPLQNMERIHKSDQTPHLGARKCCHILLFD